MKRDLIALLILLGLIAGFSREVWMNGQSPFGGDIAVQFYPWKSYAKSMLSEGSMPSWNPYTHAGTPFMANVQSAVLYPFDILLFLLPMEYFFGASLLLHLLIAAGGAYALARICGASAFPALIAGLAYGLNGFTMIHILFGNHLTYAGAAWAPWLFFATTGYVLQKAHRATWMAAGALIVFLHFSCGHPQMLFYSLVFCTLYAFALLYWHGRRCGNTEWRPLLGWGALWLSALALGGLMTAYQVFSTLEYLPYANRASGLAVEAATEFSFAPHRLITLLFAEFYGTHLGGNHYDPFYYWSCAYTGVAIPLLAIVLFRRGVRPVASVPLLGVALLGLFLAWGRGNPIYALLLELPGFGHFRAPAKYLPYFIIPLCTLAALSLERLSAESYNRLSGKTDGFSLATRAVPVVVLVILMLAFGYPAIASSYESLREATGISTIRMMAVLIGSVLVLATAAAILLGRGVPRIPRLALCLAVGVVLCVDLFAFGRGYFTATLIDPEWIRKINETPSVVETLQESDGYASHHRVVTSPDVAYPNRLMLWNLHTITGYDPLSLRSYMDMIGEMEGWEEHAYHDNVMIETFDHPVLDRLNVHYVLTAAPLTPERVESGRLTQVGRGPAHVMYQREGDSIAWAATAAYDETPPASEEWTATTVEMKQYDPEEIAFRVSIENPAWLRLSEWYYPGWSIWVRPDGGRYTPHTLTPSPEGMRMIALEPGTWDVRLLYPEPWGRWLLTALGWIIFGKLVGAAVMIRRGTFLAFIQQLMGRYY